MWLLEVGSVSFLCRVKSQGMELGVGGDMDRELVGVSGMSFL